MGPTLCLSGLELPKLFDCLRKFHEGYQSIELQMGFFVVKRTTGAGSEYFCWWLPCFQIANPTYCHFPFKKITYVQAFEFECDLMANARRK